MQWRCRKGWSPHRCISPLSSTEVCWFSRNVNRPHDSWSTCWDLSIESRPVDRPTDCGLVSLNHTDCHYLRRAHIHDKNFKLLSLPIAERGRCCSQDGSAFQRGWGGGGGQCLKNSLAYRQTNIETVWNSVSPPVVTWSLRSWWNFWGHWPFFSYRNREGKRGEGR